MDPEGVLSQPSGSVPPARATRGPRLGLGGEGARSLLIALVSTIVVFGLIGYVVVNSPGWPRVQAQFLDGHDLLGLAAQARLEASGSTSSCSCRRGPDPRLRARPRGAARSLPGPVFFPLRLMATIYVDVFRALPGVLVIFVLGFGIPALRIEGVPNDEFFWAVIALTLVYSAYVSEVYRAGHRIGPPEPGRGGAVARPVPAPDDALRRASRRRSGASSRRCSTTSSGSRRTPSSCRSSASSRSSARPRS